MTIKLRYKAPDGDVSKLITHAVADNAVSIESSTDNFRFSAAVAEFGLLLRSSKYKQSASFRQVVDLARSAKGADPNGYRSEFIKLVQNAGSLALR